MTTKKKPYPDVNPKEPSASKPRKGTDYPRLIDDEADTIEQHLDMKESGPLRGDEILHHHGLLPEDDATLRNVDEMMENYRIDMSEKNREGAEMSGDDHSFGLQGGEPEIRDQPHIPSGLPGDETDHQEEEESDLERRRGA